MSKTIEEVAMDLQLVVDWLREYCRILNLPSCNDCKKLVEGCKHRPELGGVIRFNCPLWEAEVVDK